MSPCSPNDNSINVTPAPGIPVPPSGPLFSPPQIPLPDLGFPDDILEDIKDLLDKLGALFPSGLFKPNPDGAMKDVMDFISNLLTQLAPFLSFYNFIMALLNLIICIIEVLCAIPNPFAVASKLKRLFAECLPPFLNLFPWLALIAMILALLLLILALILYIINTIIKIIEEIIKNLIAFGETITLQDANAAIATAAKIASLLCIIENILAVLIAVAAVMAIIQSLMAFAGTTVCDDADSEGCCPTEICPNFIKDNKEIEVTNGLFVYYNQIGPDLSSLGLPQSLVDLLGNSLLLRPERWQLYDVDESEIPISLIVKPTFPVFFGGSRAFYPDQDFAADTPPNRAPYTVDMTLNINPIVFGHVDNKGDRTFKINDCIVVRRPHVLLINHRNAFDLTNTDANTGVFDLEGGLVFEEDGETPFEIDGEQATLNTFIHTDIVTGTDLPTTDDGYVVSDVEFVWKPVHPALASHSLITVGCMPEVSLEKAALNAVINAEGTEAVLDRLLKAPDGVLVPSIGVLPNIIGAQECVQNALDLFRKDVSIDGAAKFQATMETCLNDLANQTTAVFCDAFIKAVSQYKSKFVIDTDAQFTTREILVSVTLRDAGGTNIATGIPEKCLNNILDKLEAEVTLGEVSEFTYNSLDSVFNTNLTSKVSGTGELRILFDSKVLSTFTSSADFDVPSSIVEDVLNYSFIDADAEEAVRRGPPDISGDGN